MERQRKRWRSEFIDARLFSCCFFFLFYDDELLGGSHHRKSCDSGGGGGGSKTESELVGFPGQTDRETDSRIVSLLIGWLSAVSQSGCFGGLC